MRRPTRSPRLATLCVLDDTSASAQDNKARIGLLRALEKMLQEHRDWHPLDAILLPGGFFWLSMALETAPFDQRTKKIGRSPYADETFGFLARLAERSPGLRLVTGVMAQPRDIEDASRR